MLTAARALLVGAYLVQILMIILIDRQSVIMVHPQSRGILVVAAMAISLSLVFISCCVIGSCVY